MLENFLGAALGGFIFYGGKYFLVGKLPHWFDVLMSLSLAFVVSWYVTRSRTRALESGK